MSGWDSYRAVYGAELRAAAREFLDHGWPVVEESDDTLMLGTGRALDVLEVPAAIGRGVCAQLRDADIVAPVAATPTGSWWYPVTPGAAMPAVLQGADGVVLHGAGDAVAAPPSQVPDGWVHWRVPPAACEYGVAPAALIFSAAATAVSLRVVDDAHPGAQRPAGVVAVGMRS
jgi:bifunctional DNA primase/polymerase-like protein